MKITAIKAYQVDLPLNEGSYKWSGGKSVSVFDSTVVAVETDAGLVGYGESCPLGPVYLPSYAAGVRAGLAELAPHLIGALDASGAKRLIDGVRENLPIRKLVLGLIDASRAGKTADIVMSARHCRS